jgi:hypothetical protein
VKSRLKRSFWVDGGGAARVAGTEATDFKVVGGMNVSADKRVRCVRRTGAARLVGAAATAGVVCEAVIVSGADSC